MRRRAIPAALRAGPGRAVRERAARALRYYRALYSQLFRKEAGSSAKAAMFLNLLFKVLPVSGPVPYCSSRRPLCWLLVLRRLTLERSCAQQRPAAAFAT